jgi:sirohydrochlorin ferrochelatase
MKTIYLVRKMGRYSTAPTNIRAFEAMEDAEDLIGVLKLAGSDDIEVVPIELSQARAAPQPQPAMENARDRLGRGMHFTHTQVIEPPEVEAAQ